VDCSAPACAEELVALRGAYLDAQLRGERREALALIVERGLGRGFGVDELRRCVLAEAQREVGQLWQQNAISVAQEHLATAISQVALAHLYDRAPLVPRNGKRVVFACVEGELHEFPARLAADALDLAGFDVRYLGASVPSVHLAELLRSDGVDLLGLSVTMAFNLDALRRTIPLVRAASPTLAIAAGGDACIGQDALLKSLGVTLTAATAEQLVTGARRLLGVESS
jgi:MerR family transcriptional regulator, light-induced transcriptional regulator